MQNQKTRRFIEDPIDIETVFEALSVASRHGDLEDNATELLFMDKLISHIRLDPYCDITTISHKILCDLDVMKQNVIKMKTEKEK